MATLGIDISSWQDNNSTAKKIDWNLARSKGAVFAFIRCCNGFTADEDFEYNWGAAKEAGLLRGAYLFHDYRASPSGQARYFASRLKKDPGELPPVLDIEKYWKPTPSRDDWLAAIQNMIAALKNEGFSRVIFYSNPDTILYTFSPIPDWMSAIPLWIAHYKVTQPSEKAVAPWKKWTFWQYTASGDGLAFGMESKGLDMDWFNGTEAELCAFAGKPLPDSSGSTAEPTLEEKVALLWKAHPEIWPK